MGPSFKVPNAVLGEITLPDEIFQDSLNNKSSSEARYLTTELKQGIEEILREKGYRYETVDILKFRRGSVVASFVVVSGDRYLPAHEVQGAIRAFLEKNGGTLRGKVVDSNSVKAQDATNECKLDNGDCVGSACEWNYLTSSKICHCSAGTSRYNATHCLPQPLHQTTVVQPTEGAKDLETSTVFSPTSAVPITEAMTSESPTTAPAIKFADPEPTETEVPSTTTRKAMTTLVTSAGSDTTAAYVTESFTTSPYFLTNLTDAVTTTAVAERATSTTQEPSTEVITPLALDTTTSTTAASDNGLETMITTVSDGILKKINDSAMTSTESAVHRTVALNHVTTLSPEGMAITTATVGDGSQTTVTSRRPLDATTFTPLFVNPKGENFLNETGENLTTATDVTSPIAGTTLLDFLMTTMPAVTFWPSATENPQTSRGSVAATVPSTTTTAEPNLTKTSKETTMTPSTSNDTVDVGTAPPVLVYSNENMTTIAPPTEHTAATSAPANSTDENNSTQIVTTEMPSSFRDMDEEHLNGTSSGLDFNATMSTLQNSTVSELNMTVVVDIKDSPTAGNDTFELTTVYPDGNTTASLNMTDGSPITVDTHNATVGTLNATLARSPVGNSSLEEMDPELNVSNRTFAMGRNLTFMNNNTLAKDGADVINGTMDSWNMTANGTLLNSANFSFLDDGGVMATEGANMSHSGTTAMMDFLNETLANSTDDVFRDLCSAGMFQSILYVFFVIIHFLF